MEQKDSIRKPSTRRGFLRNAAGVSVVVASGGLVGAALEGPYGLGPIEAQAQDIPTILDVATTGEALAATLHHAVVTRATFHIDDPARASLQHLLASDLQQYDVLRSLGGRSQARQFYVPRRLLSDASVFVQTSLTIERAIAGAYVAATHRFAVLGQPLLAVMAARHGANAAQHLSLIGHLAGLPYDATTPIDAATPALETVLTPFLAAGRDVTGPLRFPSEALRRAAVHR